LTSAAATISDNEPEHLMRRYSTGPPADERSKRPSTTAVRPQSGQVTVVIRSLVSAVVDRSGQNLDTVGEGTSGIPSVHRRSTTEHTG
jgi:hypothetical protein